MSFSLSGFENFAFDFECPLPENISFDDSFPSLDDIPFNQDLPSLDYSNAVLDGLTAPAPMESEMCVSPSQLRKPSASRWAPLDQPSPKPVISSRTSLNQRQPSRWVPLSPPTAVSSRVQSPHLQYQYPTLDPYPGESQQLINSSPYFTSPSPFHQNQNDFLQASPYSSPLGPSPFQTPAFNPLYQPISSFNNENAPNAEDFALSPDSANVRPEASAPAPIATSQPTRKRRRSVHESDLESSESDGERPLASADTELPAERRDSVFSGRKARFKGTKLGRPYKYKQTTERKAINERRKAAYYGSKPDPESSDDEFYSAAEMTQSGNKKGRPYELPQTKERREKNERRRKQYQSIKDHPIVKAKAQKNSKDYYKNVRKHTRKNLALIKEIENTREFADAQGEQAEESDDTKNEDSDEEYVPRRTRSQAGKRARYA